MTPINKRLWFEREVCYEQLLLLRHDYVHCSEIHNVQKEVDEKKKRKEKKNIEKQC
jgi:hypothetical protein